jgi:hypothetical protein
VSDSYVAECHGKGFDSQAIWGANGPGPYRIENNRLEGAGENIMFGGADPAIPGLVPSDITIRRNHIVTPTSWMGLWTKKNLIETKNAVRVLIEENVLEGSWLDGQTGWAIIVKSENQSGKCRWCRSTDVTIRRNRILNAGAGINVAASGPHAPIDSAPRRIHIVENVLDDLGKEPFTGDRRAFQLLRGTSHITIERNLATGSYRAALMIEGGDPVVFRSNVLQFGEYGVVGSGATPGQAVLRRYAPGATWRDMTLIGRARPQFPPGTRFVPSERAAPLAATIRRVVSNATAGVVR